MGRTRKLEKKHSEDQSADTPTMDQSAAFMRLKQRAIQWRAAIKIQRSFREHLAKKQREVMVKIGHCFAEAVMASIGCICVMF